MWAEWGALIGQRGQMSKVITMANGRRESRRPFAIVGTFDTCWVVGACFRHIPEGVLAGLPGALGALSAPKAEGELTGRQGLINMRSNVDGCLSRPAHCAWGPAHCLGQWAGCLANFPAFFECLVSMLKAEKAHFGYQHLINLGSKLMAGSVHWHYGNK